MAFLRSLCVTMILFAGLSGALAAERGRTRTEIAQAQAAATSASPALLASPPAEGSFALPADRIETTATPGPVQAPAARPATAAPTQAAAPVVAAKKPATPLQFATISKDPRPTLDPGTFATPCEQRSATTRLRPRAAGDRCRRARR